MPQGQPDLYEVLQVRPDADQDVIQAAYRGLMFKYHPDRNAGSAEAMARTKEINQAYQTLSDPQRRAEYDRQRLGTPVQPRPATKPSASRSSPPAPRPSTQPVSTAGAPFCQVSPACRNRAIGRCSTCRRSVCRAHSSASGGLGSRRDLECGACRVKREAATGGRSEPARPARATSGSATSSGGGGPFDILRRKRTADPAPTAPNARARANSSAKPSGGALVKAGSQMERAETPESETRGGLAPAQHQVPTKAGSRGGALEVKPLETVFAELKANPPWWMMLVTTLAVIAIGASLGPALSLGIWLGHMMSSGGH